MAFEIKYIIIIRMIPVYPRTMFSLHERKKSTFAFLFCFCRTNFAQDTVAHSLFPLPVTQHSFFFASMLLPFIIMQVVRPRVCAPDSGLFYASACASAHSYLGAPGRENRVFGIRCVWLRSHHHPFPNIRFAHASNGFR